MILICKYYDSAQQVYEINNHSNYLDYIENIKLSQLKESEIRETFISLKPHTMKKLLDDIETVNEFGSVNVNVFDINDYAFEIVVSGRLIDILGVASILNIHKYTTYNEIIKSDIKVINSCITRRRINNIDTIYKSLILETLSNFNSGMSKDKVLDYLNQLSKRDMVRLLTRLFEEIYSTDYNTAVKTYNSNHVVNEKLLKEIKEYIKVKTE